MTESKHHILIVEDNKTQALKLKSFVKELGYIVSVVNDGKEALALIKKQKPSLVISDVVMPKMDGYELCRKIKEDKKSGDIPVILLTSLTDSGDVLKGIETRADDYIIKSNYEEFLSPSIHSLLANVRKPGKKNVSPLPIDSQFVKPKLLYVDDSKEYIVLFSAALKKDYEIYTAETAEEGLDILGKNKIQVVIADQRMPVMTGIELLERVAKEYPDILRFMISGFHDFKATVDGVNKGKIQGYFHKPIEPEEIRIAVNKSLEFANLEMKNQKILKELETSNIAFQNSNRNKTIFIQILSKELNKPLDEVRGTIRALKNKPNSEDYSNLVNLLYKNISKFEVLSSFANQITQLYIKEEILEPDKINTREIIECLLIEMSDKFKKRKIKFDLYEESQELFISGDFSLIINCLVIMMDDTLLHTSDNDTVRLIVGKNEKMIFFEIVNGEHNYTIEDKKSKKDFFSSNEELLNVNLNLGLVLAKQIMDIHNGKIEYTFSDKEGRIRLLFLSANS